MTTLPPLPSFKFEPAAAIEHPFEPLVEKFRRGNAWIQMQLDECVAMEDAVGAIVALTKLYLGLDGERPSQDAIQCVLPLRDVAKSRNTASK